MRRGSSYRVGTLVTYALCGSVVVAGVLDQAFGGLMGFVLLGMVGVGLAFLIHLVNLAFRIRSLGLRGLIPLGVCLAVLPAVWTIGPTLLRARFFWNRDRYEALADAVRTGHHPESLSGIESHLAHWVKATHPGSLNDKDEWPRQRASCVDAHDLAAYSADNVVAVHFLTVTHGFAGHVGFMRAFDVAAERCLQRGHGLDGWWYSKPLANHWYLVGD
jgi:hypothetical protein